MSDQENKSFFDRAKSFGGSVGKALYEATPIDNVGLVAGHLRKGEYGQALKHGFYGALEGAAMVIPGGLAARGIYGAARAGGRGAVSSAIRTLPRAATGSLRDPGKAIRTLAPDGRLKFISSTVPRRFLLGAVGSVPARAVGQMLYNRSNEEGEQVLGPGYQARLDALDDMASTDGMTTLPFIGNPLDNVTLNGDDVEGPAVPGAVADSQGGSLPADAGTGLPLSPAEQAMLDQARIDALRQLNLERSNIDLQRRGASLSAQEQMREAGRFGVTQMQDLQALASEMGFGSSPATMGVSQSELAAEEARRRMAAQSEYRGLQEQLARRGSAAQEEYQRYLNDVAMQEVQARSARGVSNVQGRYGS